MYVNYSTGGPRCPAGPSKTKPFGLGITFRFVTCLFLWLVFCGDSTRIRVFN